MKVCNKRTYKTEQQGFFVCVGKLVVHRRENSKKACVC